MFESLEPLTPLSAEIRRCIISQDEISDDASAGLMHVRRSMKVANDRIHTQLASLVNGSARNYDCQTKQRHPRAGASRTERD